MDNYFACIKDRLRSEHLEYQFEGKENVITAEHLKQGQTCKVTWYCQSMTPILKFGQSVICKPVTEETKLNKNNIVLCKVNDKYYLHKLYVIKNGVRYQIYNNHGHINGVITRKNIYIRISN